MRRVRREVGVEVDHATQAASVASSVSRGAFHSSAAPSNAKNDKAGNSFVVARAAKKPAATACADHSLSPGS